jgi:hypothetical protein
MRLLSSARYEQLVQAEAQALAYQWQIKRLSDDNGALLAQIDGERRRAENAVDALLLSKSAPPITPQPGRPLSEDLNPFDDQPDELAELYKQIKSNPISALLNGADDAK